jgi:selenocysteine-specific elongation factor
MLHLDAVVYEEVLRRLAAAGEIAVADGRVKRAGFAVTLMEAQAELLARLETIYREARFSTPRPDELTLPISSPPYEGGAGGGQREGGTKGGNEIALLLTLLLERGVLLELGDDVLFHRDSVEEARDRLVRYLQEKGEILTTDYRDLLGTTKKYAVALLDHFAATGLTRRVESKHFLRR